MREYCLGFAVSRDSHQVVLIQKARPTWQEGLLNGVGGGILPGELENTAMAREFHEETGVTIPRTGWDEFATLNYPEARVHVFRTRYDGPVTHCTDEPVIWTRVQDIPHLHRTGKLVPDLSWLIPMLCGLKTDERIVMHGV